MRFRKSCEVFLAFFTLLFILSGCGGRSAPTVEPALSSNLYLKNNIHVQERPGRGGGVLYMASYANYIDPGPGHFIVPVNTEVVIGEWRRGFTITTPAEGKVIYFEYNSRNMRMGVDEYLQLITSPTKVSLDGLSQKDLKGIKDGKAYRGMTKRGVRMALGYPAVHKTPSLKELSWTYWKNRWTVIVVDFFGDGTVRRTR